MAAGAGTALSLVSSADNNLSTVPCFMYFQERGRYDAQVTKKAHCIVGPGNFEFRTKMIVCATTDTVGEKVFVCIGEDASNRLVSCLASETAIGAVSVTNPTSGDWFAGVITRIHGTNDATVLFQPGFL